ncbi:hypothetical protein ACFLWG_00235, partial [Chloroflexota bacterium]
VTALQQQSINIVWEALLGEWGDADVTGKDKNYEPYLGKYIANFGPLKDREYTVLIQNDRLALDAAGEAVYELKEPDEEGKWYFFISDEIAVSFDRDGDGNVIAMIIHQSGLDFEIPRVDAEIAIEINLDELQKYLGSYRSEELDVTAEVLIQNNRLAVDWPGQMAYELYPPNEERIWVFRASKELTLRFNATDDGQIESLTFYQSGKEFEMLRVEGTPLPTFEEVLALRETDSRKAAIGGMGTYRLTGTTFSQSAGVEGTFSVYVSGVERYRVDSDYGKYGYSRMAVNGDRAWVESSFGPFDELYGTFLEQAKRGHPSSDFGDWRDFYDSIQVLRSDKLDEQEVYVLKLSRGDLPPATIYVDSITGDVLRSEVVALQEGGIGIPIIARLEDYRDVYGVRIPFRMISENEASGRTIVQYESIEVNLDIDDTFFILNAPTEP